MKKAMVVGPSGQDGSYLVEHLRALAYSVVGVGRGPTFAATPAIPSIDIRNGAEVRQLLDHTKPDEIYYLAAFHQSAEDPLLDDATVIPEHFSINTLALNNFLSGIASVIPAAKLFYAASSRVFGNPSEAEQDEETPFHPIEPYAISKAAGIELCRYYRRTLRVFASVGILYNHESPRRPEHFVTQKVIKAAVRIRRGQQDKLVLGDLEAVVDWGYAPEYVDAMWRTLQLQFPEDFIIATGRLHSVRELVHLAFEAVGLDAEGYIEQDLCLISPGRRARLRGNIGKISSQTGWAPLTSFPEMIKLMVKAAIDDAA